MHPTQRPAARLVGVTTVVLSVLVAATAAFAAPAKPRAAAPPPLDPALIEPDAAAASAPAVKAPDTTVVSPSSVHAAPTTVAVSGGDAGSAAAAMPEAPHPATPSTDPALAATRFSRTTAADTRLQALQARAERDGTVRVMVTLASTFRPLGTMVARDARAQRTRTLAQSDTLAALVQRRGGKVLHSFGGNLPLLAVDANAATIKALAASTEVAKVEADRLGTAELDVSMPLIGAADAQDRGFHGVNSSTGQPVVVAVLDTGVQYNHPFLNGRVTNAGCFVANNGCPNGQSSQVGGNAGIPCTFAGGCFHGTHVAGIVAGAANGATTFTGVADQARIESVQIFHSATCSGSPCAQFWGSDAIAALNFVYNDRAIGTVAVNMSIGFGDNNTTNCDTSYSDWKTIIDNLRSVGIASVIASGNESRTNGVSGPSCVSTATTVGATDDADNVAGFSNTGVLVDLLAPGVNINSSVPGSTYGAASGTSMATPTVAGAIAVMRGRSPLLTVTNAETYLATTGKPVTDSKSSPLRTLPRINLLKAIFSSMETLANDTPLDRRNPIPNPHEFRDVTTGGYWSAVAVRPPSSGGDVDLNVYDFYDYTVSLGGSFRSGSTVDFVAQDSNRRVLDWTFPKVSQYSGTGRYQIDFANDNATLPDGTFAMPMGAGDVVEIRDSYEVAGVPTFYRVVPSSGAQDPELFLMESTAGDASTYFRSRSQAAAYSIVNGAGADEAFPHISATTQWQGLVLINRAGSGTYTVYRDTTAPVGTFVIGVGNPASTNSRAVALQLALADANTGIRDMRVAVDGLVDTEPWQPYTSELNVTLPDGAGTKSVQVVVRNNANMIRTLTDTIVYDTRPNYRAAVTIGPASAAWGDMVTFTDITRNNGPTNGTAASTTRYYLSANSTWDASDYGFIGSRSVPELAAGAINTGSASVRVPDGPPAGSYYVIACADTGNVINEFSESDNCVGGQTRITIRVPDYVVTALTNPPQTIARGGKFSVGDTTKNAGNLAAVTGSSTRFFLSADAVFGATDRVLTGAHPVPALAAGGTHAAVTSVIVPTATPVGMYVLIACADATGLIGESSETNNCRASTTRVSVT